MCIRRANVRVGLFRAHYDDVDGCAALHAARAVTTSVDA